MATLTRVKSGFARILHLSGAFLLVRALHQCWYGEGIRLLFYHRVPHAFASHLRHLKRFYRVISLEQAAALLASGKLPRNAVVITFDDGYRDNYTVAMPLLQAQGMTATVFVVSDVVSGAPLWFDQVRRWFAETRHAVLPASSFYPASALGDAAARTAVAERVIAACKCLSGVALAAALEQLRVSLRVAAGDPGEPQTLSWEELRVMAASGVFTVGAHSVSHLVLNNLSDEDLKTEISGSCRRIEAELGERVRAFAYPNGDFDGRARNLVEQLGLIACTTGGGGFNPPGADLRALHRLGGDDVDIARFALYLAGWETIGTRFAQRARLIARSVKRAVYMVLRLIGFFAAVRYWNRSKLFVLLYHGVSDRQVQLDNLHVGNREFCRQMSWLSRHCTPVTIEQVGLACSGGPPLPPRAVLVTFDDAYANNLSVAAPILAKHRIPATVFVPTSFANGELTYWTEQLEALLLKTRALSLRMPIVNGTVFWLRNLEERRAAFWRLSSALKAMTEPERERVFALLRAQLSRDIGDPMVPERRLSWQELRHLTAEGFALGSHSVSHALLPGLRPDRIAWEVTRSKQELEERLGATVSAFAYPNGDWDRSVRDAVQNAGYSCAFTTQGGGNGRGLDPLLLRRVGINANDSFSEFMAAISGIGRTGRRRAQKILEISNYPPPQCGWAMNTKLLAEELRARGTVCEVLNINESRRIKSQAYTDVQNGADYLLKLVRYALRGYCFHTHVNAESPKGYLLAMAAQLAGRAIGRPAAMTFHGGLPQSFFPRNDSRALRLAFRLLFRSARAISCDALAVQRAIESYSIGPVPVAVIPCFSPRYLQFERKPLPVAVERFLAQRSPVFFCFVCFRPEYSLESLLQAQDQFAKVHPSGGFIWLGFPQKEMPLVNTWLREQPVHRGNILVLGNLDHDSFLTLLTRCFAYIRPPECDGVSASVLEALGLGIPVVAAENGRRPQGVITYRFADAVDLCRKLEYLIGDYAAIKASTRSAPAPNDHISQAADWLLEQRPFTSPVFSARSAYAR